MVMNNYIGSFTGEVQRDGASQAFGGAGDEGDFAVQLAVIRIGG